MSREIETIARRLDWLLKHRQKPDGTLYTYRDIEEISAELGYRIDAATVGRLRHGQLKQPGLLKIRALSRVFRLPDPRLLYDDEDFSDADLELATTTALLTDDAVQEIAYRSATTLNPQQREMILQMLRIIAASDDDKNND